MDVDRTNFEEILPVFLTRLKESTFVAIDCEYSGLGPPPGAIGHSLFDTAEDRYEKARAGSCYIICQFGIALFRKEPKENCYYTDCYNFYLFPTFIDEYASNESFLWEVSSIAFLKQHNFDFERCIHKGIAFLNDLQIAELKKYLSNRGTTSSKDNLDCGPDNCKISNMDSSSPMSQEEIEKLVKHHSGFQRVIKALSISEKPIIGHNMYTDLTLMFNQFCVDLPKSYQEYKSDLHNRFPYIYDTKNLAYEMKSMFTKINPKEDVSYLNNTSLCALYKNTSITEGINRPVIILGPDSKVYSTSLLEGMTNDLEDLPSAPVHQAGFDACLTGCVFTQLAYIMWQKELAKLGLIHTRPLVNIFNCFTPWVNSVNIARAWIPSINIGGKDEPSRRPRWIVVKPSIMSENKVDVKKIQSDAFKMGVGDYEIKYDAESNSACIACGTERSKRMMYKILKKSQYILSEISPSSSAEHQILSWKKVVGITTCALAVYAFYWLKQ